jgi:hypothetical protein
MGNALDNALIIRDTATLVFRNLATSVNKLQIKYTAVDPNGVVTAQIGSIASGPEGMWINTDGGTTWAPVITSEVFSLPPDEFYVDQTATAPAALYRIYPSVELAITGAEANSEFLGNARPYLVRLREGQLHLWADGAGIPVGSRRKITITCRARAGADLIVSGTLPTSGADAVISFTNIVLSLAGAWTVNSPRTMLMDEVNVEGNGNVLTYSAGTFQRSTWRDVLMAGAPALPLYTSAIFFTGFFNCRMIWTSVGAAQTLVSKVVLMAFYDTSIEIAASDFTFVTAAQSVIPIGSPPAGAVEMLNTTVFADQTGAGVARLFSVGLGNIGATSAAEISTVASGGGTIEFGIEAMNSDDTAKSLKMFGVNPKYLPPGVWYDFNAAGVISQLQKFANLGAGQTPGLTLSKLTAGSTGGASLAFAPTTVWPAGGSIDFMFPPGFNVAAAAIAVNAAADGVLTTGTLFNSPSALFVTHGVSGPQPVLPAPGNQYQLVITAGPNPVNFGSYLVNGTNSEVQLATTPPFTAAPDAGPYTYHVESTIGIDGGLTVSVSGQVVTITRDGLGTPIAPNTKCAIALMGIVNPAVTGNTERFLVAAFSGAPVNGQQDTGTIPHVTIV